MQIDVVMCVYNAKATLAEAIESVLAQTYKNLKLWIVDDGSTDTSLRIIENFAQKDSRIEYYTHTNRGCGASRNSAIVKALNKQSEFISFIDSDDVWMPEKLELQVKAFKENEDADVVVTDMIFYSESKNYTVDRAKSKTQKISDIFEILCKQNFTFQPVTALLKTDLFKKYGMYTDDHSGQDFYPFLSFALHQKCFYKVQTALYRERQIPGSLQRSPKSVLHSSKARKDAALRLLEASILIENFDKENTRLLHFAHDHYCSWMLSGARKVLPYGESIKLAFEQQVNYTNKKIYWVELTKSILHPLIKLARMN